VTGGDEERPALYGELAPWFHLLTAPSDYAPGAAQALHLFQEALGTTPRDVLELGSGGGNHASHMKASTSLTLTDLSSDMLAISSAINPECEHIPGDMRTMRLERTFDAVFAHDAISYLTTRDDLLAAMLTASIHLRPGGVALFEPDHVAETYSAGTDHGGHDGGPEDPRSLRYLQWRWDPDPTDDWYLDDFVYLLRDADGSIRSFADRHRLGAFPRATWFELLERAGFEDARTVATGYDDVEEGGGAEAFLAMKPAGVAG
jgi:SAM-dependent methyltransferase